MIREKEAEEYNSNYFHACLRYMQRRNKLLVVKSNEGWMKEVDEVKNAVKNHFQQQFKEAIGVRPNLDEVEFKLLSQQEAKSLISPF